MKTLRALAAAFAIAGTALAGLAGPAAAADKKINIGWTAWSDAEAVTKLAAKLMKDRLGYDVQMTLADIGIQYQGVATGKLDGMLMSWQPMTHQAYIEKTGKDLVDLGPMYTRAKLGWVVPEYVPADQLRSIEDLKKPDVQAKLSGKVQGIDPGAGLMRASEKALKDYGLSSYQLVSASDAAMMAAVDRAEKRNEWIVATSWSPHFMFAKWKLRYLEDPKGALGGLESVNKIVRKGFYQDYPEAFEFLNRMVLPIGDVEKIMADAQATSYDAAVDKYIAENAERVEYWVSGKMS